MCLFELCYDSVIRMSDTIVMSIIVLDQGTHGMDTSSSTAHRAIITVD